MSTTALVLVRTELPFELWGCPAPIPLAPSLASRAPIWYLALGGDNLAQCLESRGSVSLVLSEW